MLQGVHLKFKLGNRHVYAFVTKKDKTVLILPVFNIHPRGMISNISTDTIGLTQIMQTVTRMPRTLGYLKFTNTENLKKHYKTVLKYMYGASFRAYLKTRAERI